MKNILPLCGLVSICTLFTSCDKSEVAKDPDKGATEKADGHDSEKPIKHLDLPDITSASDADKVFKETTAKLKSKTKLDGGELGEIHLITYSLEKALAYFVENSEGEKKATAGKMAELCEEVHLNSENNRPEKTKAALTLYYKLADEFGK